MTNPRNDIITPEEIEALKKFEGLQKDPGGYDKLNQPGLALLCRMKDKNNDLFVRRYEAARRVIDAVARKVGYDPETCGLDLYIPEDDGEGGYTSPIVQRIDEWLSRSGEKAQLKRRVQELEQENKLLRSLIGK